MAWMVESDCQKNSSLPGDKGTGGMGSLFLSRNFLQLLRGEISILNVADEVGRAKG